MDAEWHPSFIQHSNGAKHIHLQKKEMVAMVGFVFAFMAAVGALFCVQAKDLTFARRWAAHHWVEADCHIKQVGVAYRGNCDMDVTLRMTKDTKFEECMGPEEDLHDAKVIREEWETMQAGRCAARGDAAYNGERPPPGVGQAHPFAPSSKADSTIHDQQDGHKRVQPLGEHPPVVTSERSAPARSLLRAFHAPPQRIMCHNSYLPWAVMNTSGLKSTCAYEFGAETPSRVGDWKTVETLVGQLKKIQNFQRTTKCWVLRNDNCVVAFKTKHWLTRVETGEHVVVRLSVLLCTVLALITGAFWAALHFQEPPSGGYHSRVPTCEPLEAPIPLSERVRQIVNVTGQHICDATPTASGASTIRLTPGRDSPRTVEVMLPGGDRASLPKNIAADFAPLVR